MAGPTTTGLTALLEGEGWHYVGDTGEPAFGTGWQNNGVHQNLAYRIRETGVVDIVGVVTTNGSGSLVFTLPAGYAPNTTAYASALLDVAGTYTPARLSVSSGGALYVEPVATATAYLSVQVFLNVPDSP